MEDYPNKNDAQNEGLKTHNLDQEMDAGQPGDRNPPPAPEKKPVPIKIIKRVAPGKAEPEKTEALEQAQILEETGVLEEPAMQAEPMMAEEPAKTGQGEWVEFENAEQAPAPAEVTEEKKGLFKGLFAGKAKKAPEAEPPVFVQDEAEVEKEELEAFPGTGSMVAVAEPVVHESEPVLQAGQADAPAPPQKPKKAAPVKEGDFKQRVWGPWLRPITVLTAICLITSLLLSLTNYFTKPIIAANTEAMATASRQALLPEATGFVDETPSPLESGITSVYRAENDVGYVIEAYAKGYGGNVPVMVAFDAQGNIAGVKFMENAETPGLGKNIEKPKFAAQFAALPGNEQIDPHGIDSVAAATISSNAAVMAVNAAIQYYFTQIQGGVLHYDISDKDLQSLMQNATSWDVLDVEAPGIAGVYLGDNGVYVIVGQAQGNGSTVTAAVALSEDGRIFGLLLDVSGETPENQELILKDAKFMDSFINQTSVDGIDGVAGATGTSDAVKEAVGYALSALPLAKEAVG